jgi:hypothetical protein
MNHDASVQSGALLSECLRRPVNWLLAFVPITVALEHVGGVPARSSLFNFAAINTCSATVDYET